MDFRHFWNNGPMILASVFQNKTCTIEYKCMMKLLSVLIPAPLLLLTDSCQLLHYSGGHFLVLVAVHMCVVLVDVYKSRLGSIVRS
jgi:hypothetical protein